MPTKTNARHAIERLLTTETSPGRYCTGSEITSCPIPSVEIIHRDVDAGADERGRKKLSFPLDAKGVADIKENAERAGVGLLDRTIVNLDVRTTWQIKPRNLHVSNIEQALESALHAISRELGTETEYNIEASLYKLLLYEPGCFFARHRDNERLDGMFGTLVLELPSEYEGAELKIWSPLTPNEKTIYTFNGGGGSSSKRKSSGGPGLHFAAFYADCYHEVSKLTSGHRVALIYHLTANPVQTRLLPHLPMASPSPPQPANESIAMRLSKLVDTFSREGDGDYPRTWEYCSRQWPGKPKKLAVVLSHHYTPASLSGMEALKGSDRSLAELIRAAAFCSPAGDDITSLARLAARKVMDVGGEQYATDPEGGYAHELISQEFKGNDGGPFFDAAISLATVHDLGEAGPQPFHTTGPLISLTCENAFPLDLGPKQPNDREADYHPSWFGGQDNQGPPFQFQGPVGYDGMPAYHWFGPTVFGEQAWMRMGEPGNHSLPIYSHELLFASEETSIKFREDQEDNGEDVIVNSSPKEVEFLGNGMPYMGRIYSRAVILIWPKAHRRDVQMQSKGGRAALKEKGDTKK